MSYQKSYDHLKIVQTLASLKRSGYSVSKSNRTSLELKLFAVDPTDHRVEDASESLIEPVWN